MIVVESKKEVVFYVITAISFIISGMLLGYLYFSNEYPLTVTAAASYDTYTTVACGSNSMAPTFDCNDLLQSRRVNYDETLVPGKIYIYKKETSTYYNLSTVVHRLVTPCENDVCVLMGDNNKVGETINRSQITYEVVGVVYQ
jgi:hypothetical protein